MVLQLAESRPAAFTAAGGARYLATFNGSQFVFAGKVGSGLTQKIAASLEREIRAKIRRTPVFISEVKPEKDAVWVEPSVVVEVRYKNWPDGLSIREPAFIRVRDDKTVHECPAPKDFRVAAPAAPRHRLPRVR